MGLTEFLIHTFVNVIDKLGYFGIGLLMTMESMVLPVPSEAVMPFAGFLWHDGKMTWWIITIVSTTGSIIGSLISYWIGAVGGRPFVNKIGKYLLLNERHLEKTYQFFLRNGEKTIFISRFIPVVRHLISIPAGFGRMRLSKFIAYTIAGAAIWNTLLAYLGYLLGSNWTLIRKYAEYLDILIVLAIVFGIIYLIVRTKKNRQAPAAPPTV